MIDPNGVRAIIELAEAGHKISKSALNAIDRRAAATGQTREGVLRELAQTARELGKEASAAAFEEYARSPVKAFAKQAALQSVAGPLALPIMAAVAVRRSHGRRATE